MVIRIGYNNIVPEGAKLAKASGAKPGVYSGGNERNQSQDRPAASQEKRQNQRKLVTQSKGSTIEKEEDHQGRI